MGFAWIFISDHIVDTFFYDSSFYTSIHIYKGFFYVIITSVLLYYLIKRHQDKLDKENAKLNASEAKFRNLFENHTAVQLIIDPEDGKIIAANNAAIKFYGYTPEQFEKMCVKDINILSPKQIKHEMESARANQKNYFEFKHRKADGTIVDVEVYSNAVQIDGKEYLYSIVHDITQKNLLKKELISSKEKAEEHDRLKTAFLQNISHEIRTPLNGILGFSQLLQDEDNSPEDIKEYTNVIIKSGNRLLELVNNILDISKIETGQLEIQKSTFSLKTVFYELAAFFEYEAKSRRLQLIFPSMSHNEDYLIHTDYNRFFQIFMNLIKNALKFTPQGSVKFGFQVNDDEYLFYVSDTGIGIPKEMEDKIFERFVQVESSKTINYQGAGLGLSICKGLVELLGGRIWYDSALGIGTTFYFTIPKDKAVSQKVNVENGDKKIEFEQKLTILVAEDDEHSYQLLEKYLSNSNSKILHAKDGKEALEIFKNHQDIDLILLDIKMPEINGFDVAQAIRKENSTVKIIAQTAYAQLQDKEKALQSGCDDFIAKPYRKKDIISLIKKLTQ